MVKRNESDSNILRVHIKFKKRIELFMIRYEREKGIPISSTQATKLVDDKIEKLGGLKIL